VAAALLLAAGGLAHEERPLMNAGNDTRDPSIHRPGNTPELVRETLRGHVRCARADVAWLRNGAQGVRLAALDSIGALLDNAARILGELDESERTAAAQADLDTLRRWNARRAAMLAGATWIELTAEQAQALERDGIEADALRVAVLAEAAARADERGRPCHVIMVGGSVFEVVNPSRDGGS
jgi:hypothetical protein